MDMGVVPGLAALAAPVVRFTPLVARPLRSSDERQAYQVEKSDLHQIPRSHPR